MSPTAEKRWRPDARSAPPRAVRGRWSCGAARRWPSSRPRRSRRRRSRAWRSSASRPWKCASTPSSPPGGTPNSIGELQQLTTEHPWRERLHAQLMLALYRSGRQADALEAYRHARDGAGRAARDRAGPRTARASQAMPDARRSPAARPRAVDAAGPCRSQRAAAPPNRTIGRADELEAIGERLRTADRCGCSRSPGLVGSVRHGWRSRPPATSRPTSPTVRASFRWPRCDAREEVPAAIVSALGDRRARGRVRRAGGRALSGDQAAPAGGRQLRARAGAAPFIGGLLGSCPGRHGAGDQPRAARLAGRAATRCRRWRCPKSEAPGSEALADVAAVALFCERARAHDPGVRAGHGNAARCGDLSAARWAAAGDRARRGPLWAAIAGRDSRASRGRRSARWVRARVTRPRASRRCARRSTGATSCSATRSRAVSRGSLSSRAARR